MKAEICDFFSVEYSSMILEHCNRIRGILAQYDVAIFMARKSVCLLKALIENEEISVESDCQILSSRALSYSCIEAFKNKKIAIIDDVVVIGKTIMNVMKRLGECNLEADVFIMACEKDFFDTVSFKGYIKEGCQYLKEEEIHQISDQITEYIVCSGISYNVDQPIFDVCFDSEESINTIIYDNHKINNISDGAQIRYGIENFTIHFKSDIAEQCGFVDEMSEMPLLKIRFIHKKDENKTIAIPFVLLPELTYADVDRLFFRVIGDKYNQWTLCDDKKHEIKNKLKLLHYALSEMLFYQFTELNGISIISKEKFNEHTLFPFEIGSFSDKKCEYKCELDYKNEINCIEDRFYFDQVLFAIYEYLNSCDRTNPKDIKVITYKDLAEYLHINFDQVNMYMISSVADVLIDKGILVPAILNDDEGQRIERGFRFGEIFRLTKDAINLFHTMLRQYQNQKKADLDRTEFEKLCTIFMRKVGYLEKGILSVAKDYSEDNFSICYTRFGSRVSSSSSVIDVPAYTSFANRMIEEKRMTNAQGRKYRIKSINVSFPEGWESKAINFAISYGQIRNCFGGPGSISNKYIRSFNDFLTIIAIGRKNEDKLYSLVAELKLFDKINTEQELEAILYDMHYYADNQYGRRVYKGIMDGIGSGMWKYACFCQEKIVSEMFYDAYKIRKCDSARYLQEDYMAGTVDTNPYYQKIIKKSAELLYRVGLCFEVAYKKYMYSDNKHVFRDIIYDQQISSGIINEYEQFTSKDDYIIELQRLQFMVKSIVDETNMIAEKHSYFPQSTYENCFAILDDEGIPLHHGGKRFSSAQNINWIIIPRDNRELDEQARRIRKDYNVDDSKDIYCFDLSQEYLRFIQNGTEISGTNLSKVLNKIYEKGQGQFCFGKTEIHIENVKNFNIIREANMGDTNITNNFAGVGATITGRENHVEQSSVAQMTHNQIFAEIEKINLDPRVFSPEIVKEIEEIKTECREKEIAKEEKFKSIMNRLGGVVGKITLETAKTVIPKIVMSALIEGGFTL